MKDYQTEFPVGKMCKVLNVSKSGFYNARNYIPSKRDSENRSILSEICGFMNKVKPVMAVLVSL